MITYEALEAFNYYRYADPPSVQRGVRYYQQGRVYEIEYNEDFAVCMVRGSGDNEYEVVVSQRGKKELGFSCTCPYADQGYFCKHMMASFLALREYLRSEVVQEDWKYQLGLALQKAPRRTTGSKAHRYVAVFLLQKDEYYSGVSFKISAAIVKAAQWGRLHHIGDDSAAINQALDEGRGWVKYLDQPYQNVNPAGCMNLAPEGVAFFNFIVQHGRYYGYSEFSDYLPIIAQMDIPVFLHTGRNKVYERVYILNEPQEIKAALMRDGEVISLQAGVQFNGQLFTSAKKNLDIVSEKPPWALLVDKLVPVANPESLDLLRIFPLHIPAEQEDIFREKYFLQIAERIPIEGDVVHWEDVQEEAIPRLYLHNDAGTLRADLRFGYGEYETEPDRSNESVSTLDNPGSWTLTRVHRQQEREADFYQLLTDAKYGLKRANKSFAYGTFEIRARTHPFDFLMHSIPALTDAGFEIYGDKDALGKVSPHTPSISLNITSGIDWFELDAVVLYGDQQVDLREIRRVLKKGDRYIKLADGSIGQIPDQWLERYKHLFEMAEETDGGLRVSDLQLSLVDELLADAAQANVVTEFYEKRERLKGFEDIQPQPVPQGFTGELRPYQKSGLDWLHFLKEYGFGGILADDMGLGKTIQVLAFLQSLREQDGPQNAVLLVVPKSLLANWQRESAVFTPDLRILEYMGISRDKDVETFKAYDIILTTYGTMLRDIKTLRGYRFSYAILDESQAIKNPLAQSAKAARLINAERRLCMTGTPVENNTFELWSQFAFLNPGLLGSMTYFKSEFANPIESRQDEETASLLKRMVYPFILRRTKKQVAPELPPRTERIIYTELEPAQRKLYDRTREYYRAQLLGMIEESGMDQARMKILEGLLRMRQICIHPALVEPTYKKDSAKFVILLETLETLQSEGHKALIFSQFVQTLKLLEVEMKKRGFTYTYLDGKTKDRQGRVDQFQDDPSISFFLISLKAGGVGLNLTAADYVIHLDPWWNPAVEMQAADRAHRIGQDKPVFIYKFIAKETVEEKILELQNRKKDLVEQLISSEGSFFKSLTGDDVKVLFS
ncbi:MAG: SNF2-related protein [Anaerolineaceae bacterium]|jgi:non-specific serine/threonine protein kinase|nr:SNF2-related protein [Anaerolineaceae bacterium]